MKNTLLVVLLVGSIFGILPLYSHFDNERKIEKYTLSALNLIIENSDISTDYRRNTYNTNYTGNVSKVYCSLESPVQSFLINTYYYNFKHMDFRDII